MRSILVESDPGPGSDAAVRGAAALALGSGATLHVVHALGLVGLPLREAVAALEGGVAERAADALREQLARVLAGYAVAAVPLVDYRSPDHALREQARAADADLVVVGSPRQADAMARGSGPRARPVLAHREPFRWPPRSILLPVDESPACAGVVRAARDWLRRALPGAPGHAGERRLELLELPAAASPADHVLDRAAGADLIVLPLPDGGAGPRADRTRGQVLHRAPCPVLLLPVPADPGPEPPDRAPEPLVAPLAEEELVVGA